MPLFLSLPITTHSYVKKEKTNTFHLLYRVKTRCRDSLLEFVIVYFSNFSARIKRIKVFMLLNNFGSYLWS